MTLNNLLYPSTYVSAGNNTPPSWYEFLLKPDLMKQHLSEADPDPSASSLIKQFFEQANRPVNDQGQILPPQDNLRNKKVRKLALQAAAHMKWDLNELDAQLSISVRHQLLSELMKACHAVTPPPQNALESMHDHTISALVLYYRWSARIVMKSTFPRKPGGRITPTVPQAVPYQANAQQRMDELRNQILGILKQQLSSMVPFLEAILHHIERPIYLPSYETIGAEQLCSTDDKSVDIMVSCEELHAQISYDLGCLHFAHNFFDKAGEMFINAREWMKRITSHQSAFCSIDKETLESYQIACHMLVKPDEPLSNSIPYEHGCIYMKVVNCLKQKEKGIHELKDLIIEDIYKKELSSAFLNDVERSLLYKDATLYGGDALFDIKWTMGLHRAVKGVEQPVCVWTEEMNVAQLHRIIGFVQQISPYLTIVESDNVGNFLCSLANNLSESSLRSQLLNFEVTRHLINGDDLNNLVLRLEDKKLLPRVLEDASPSSPEDCSTSPSTSDVIKSMERELLMTLQPHEIKATLNRLHSATSGRRFNNLCLQWELPASYGSAFTSISDPLASDFIHISIAKARHCTDDQDYSSSKSILQYLQANHTSDTKLQKLVGRELLKVELLELLTDNSLTYSEKDECNELRTQLSDVVTRCRHLITNYSDQSKQDTYQQLVQPSGH
nr:integrator complex subunit 8-like [Ciona intestinalis]|eukprot:XP_002119892.3 integrator complex subunit 8-like [Ciona intestinalis]